MARNTSIKRIRNELQQLKSESEIYDSMFKLNIDETNIYHYKAEIYGPDDSLYQNQKFDLSIDIPTNYPLSPPTIKFISDINHINVNSMGQICLNILKQSEWTPSQNLRSVIISIISLLAEPNVDDPFNLELASMYKDNYELYLNKIKRN